MTSYTSLYSLYLEEESSKEGTRFSPQLFPSKEGTKFSPQLFPSKEGTRFSLQLFPSKEGTRFSPWPQLWVEDVQVFNTTRKYVASHTEKPHRR